MGGWSAHRGDMTDEKTLAIDHLVLETVEEAPGQITTRVFRHTLQGRQEPLTIRNGNQEEAYAFLKPLADLLGVELVHEPENKDALPADQG